jgi:hypothetical protein
LPAAGQITSWGTPISADSQARRLARATALSACVAGLLSVGHIKAFASAGCDAVNAGGFNVVVPAGSVSTLVIVNFAVGDQLTFVITLTSGNIAWELRTGNLTLVAQQLPPGATRSYTVTGANSDTALRSQVDNLAGAGPATVTATCTPAGSGSQTGSDSQKLTSLQTAFSKIVSQTSGAAIAAAADAAIGGAFGGGGNPITVSQTGVTLNFAAEPMPEVARRSDQALSALAYARQPRGSLAPRDWSIWADVRGTGWNRNDNNPDFNGNQLNVTAGIGRKLNPNVLVGLIGGYEQFKYTSTALNGTFKGDGGTVGGYVAWRFAPTLRWDATVAWSSIDYDATAGSASGTFQGSRWLASTGLTGNYRWTAFVFEPSAKVFALWERQTDWTDSLGTAHAARNFSAGRVSAGGKVIAPWQALAKTTVAPYAGLYADWRFSSENAVPAGQPIVGIGDGWSGRVTGGLMLSQAGGGTFAFGGEYGGLGANYKMWGANGRLLWPF